MVSLRHPCCRISWPRTRVSHYFKEIWAWTEWCSKSPFKFLMCGSGFMSILLTFRNFFSWPFSIHPLQSLSIWTLHVKRSKKRDTIIYLQLLTCGFFFFLMLLLFFNYSYILSDMWTLMWLQILMSTFLGLGGAYTVP